MARNNDTNITIRIPKEVKEWLVEEAERKDVSASHIVRKALEGYKEYGYYSNKNEKS